MTHDEILTTLRARGVTRAIASFSGGGDEGALDEVLLVDAGGGQQVLQRHWQLPDGPPLTSEQRQDNALGTAMDDLINWEYGFDKEISGRVIWDAVRCTVHRSPEPW